LKTPFSDLASFADYLSLIHGRTAVAERRKSTRSRVLKSAKLVIDRASIIDCVVRNLTNKGARILIANTVDLPPDFEMTFDGGHSIRPCRLIWRTVTETGVEFVQAA
jgi:hypothetical protein